MLLTTTEAISDPNLLGDHFAGYSWATWRAVIKAAEGLPLDPDELMRFRSVAGDRDPPAAPVSQLVVIAGRRSGKDSIASAIATVAAVRDYSAHLRPGEKASILCLAVNRDQAGIVHGYISGYFQTVPLLAGLVTSETDDTLDLSNGNQVVVATNSFRAVRGRTIAAAILDEAAFWRSEDSANPDTEVYNAILPGTVTIPGALIVVISTAYRPSGLVYDKYATYFGQNDPNVLVVYGPTASFNPTIPPHVIENALAADRDAAAAEWLSEWRSDIADFLSRDLVDAATDRDTPFREPTPRTTYFAAADVASGSGSDSYTAAIAHTEGDLVICDAVFERRPPFDPDAVTADVVALLRKYRVHHLVGDGWGKGLVKASYRRHNVTYEETTTELTRSKTYLEALPIFTARKARIPDHARLRNQLIALERKPRPGGHDSVDHPRGGHDDVANSAALAMVIAAKAGGGSWANLITSEVLARSHLPPGAQHLPAPEQPAEVHPWLRHKSPEEQAALASLLDPDRRLIPCRPGGAPAPSSGPWGNLALALALSRSRRR